MSENGIVWGYETVNRRGGSGAEVNRKLSLLKKNSVLGGERHKDGGVTHMIITKPAFTYNHSDTMTPRNDIMAKHDVEPLM